MSTDTNEQVRNLTRGPLVVGFDGAVTARDIRSRWEAEFASWTLAYQNSLWHWCCCPQVFDGDEIDDPNKLGLADSYYFKTIGRDGRLLDEHAALSEVVDSFKELLFSSEDPIRFGIIRRTGCYEPYSENPVIDDPQALALRNELTTSVEKDVEHEFCRWIETGHDVYNLNLYCFSAYEYDYAWHTLLSLDESARQKALQTKVAVDRNAAIERLKKHALARAVNRHLIAKAVERRHFDSIVQDCNNGWCVLLVREAYLAGLRMMIDALLEQSFDIVSENDLRHFLQLETHVMCSAREAYTTDGHGSLFGFEDADVVGWSTPVMTGERLPSYLAWRAIDKRLHQVSTLCRDSSTELSYISGRFRLMGQQSPCNSQTPAPDVSGPQREEPAVKIVDERAEGFTSRQLLDLHKIDNADFKKFDKALRNGTRNGSLLVNVDWYEVSVENATLPKFRWYRSESVMKIISRYLP